MGSLTHHVKIRFLKPHYFECRDRGFSGRSFRRHFGRPDWFVYECRSLDCFRLFTASDRSISCVRMLTLPSSRKNINGNACDFLWFCDVYKFFSYTSLACSYPIYSTSSCDWYVMSDLFSTPSSAYYFRRSCMLHLNEMVWRSFVFYLLFSVFLLSWGFAQ